MITLTCSPGVFYPILAFGAVAIFGLVHLAYHAGQVAHSLDPLFQTRSLQSDLDELRDDMAAVEVSLSEMRDAHDLDSEPYFAASLNARPNSLA